MYWWLVHYNCSRLQVINVMSELYKWSRIYIHIIQVFNVRKLCRDMEMAPKMNCHLKERVDLQEILGIWKSGHIQQQRVMITCWIMCGIKQKRSILWMALLRKLNKPFGSPLTLNTCLSPKPSRYIFFFSFFFSLDLNDFLLMFLF